MFFKKTTTFILLVLIAVCSFFAVRIKVAKAEDSFSFAPIFTNNMVLQRDKEVKIFGFGVDGSSVSVEFGDQIKTTTVISEKWSVTLDAMNYTNVGKTIKAVSDGKEIKVSNVVVGEVWLASGQSNMELSIAYCGFEGYEDYQNVRNIRIVNIPNGTAKTPQKYFAETVNWLHPTSINDLRNYSAYAVGFALKLQQGLETVPVGIIQSDFSGSAIEEWMNEDSIAKTGSIAEAMGKAPVERYNQMIYPMLSYTLGGLVWYHGDANVERPDLYLKQLKVFIEQYREEFSDMYVISQNLTGFNDVRRPEFRQMQWDSMKEIENYYIVNGIDTGLKNDRHSRDKFEVSSRAGEIALTKIFNKSGYRGLSPYPSEAINDRGTVTISFENLTGTIDNRTPVGGKLVGFELLGTDGNYYAAEAEVKGNKVVVKSEKVPQPIAVRYAYEAFPTIYLYSSDNNPFAPFMFPVLSSYVKLNVNIASGGSIKGKTGYVVKDSVLEYEIVEENGFKLQSVKVDGNNVSVENNKFLLTADTDKNIEIQFTELSSYSVTAIVNGKGGKAFVDSDSVYENGTVKIYIVPEKNYAVGVVTVNGQKTEISNNSFELENVTEDISVEVSFVEQKQNGGCASSFGGSFGAMGIITVLLFLFYKKQTKTDNLS